MYGWTVATRCRLFLLTLATMASYIKRIITDKVIPLSSCHREELCMFAAPTWYRWRWSTTFPGMGQRGRPVAVAMSAKVSCRLDRWMCLGEEPSLRQSPCTVSGPETAPPGERTIRIQFIVPSSSWGEWPGEPELSQFYLGHQHIVFEAKWALSCTRHF